MARKSRSQEDKPARKPAKKASKLVSRPTGNTGKPAGHRRTAANVTKATVHADDVQRRALEAAESRPPLTKAQLKEFRNLLLAKRRSLVGDVNGIEQEARNRGGSGDLSTMPDHPANIASENYEQEFMLGLLESERQLLNEIDEALERIDRGTYGVCLGTGKPIGLARLQARPWAKYCIEYARLLEKGLVRPGDKFESEDEPESDEDEEAEDFEEAEETEEPEERETEEEDTEE